MVSRSGNCREETARIVVAIIASDERPGKFWIGKLTLVQESGAKGLPIIRERLCFEHSNESEDLRHEEQDGRRGR